MTKFDPNAPIDPNNPEYDKPAERFNPREGRKVFAITGVHRDVAPFGPTILIGLVVVKDLAPDDDTLNPPNDLGLSSSTKLTINERGMKWIGKFAKNLKYNAPFVAIKDEGNFDEVIASNKGILIGSVSHRQYLPKGKEDKLANYVTVSEVQDYEVADLAALGLTQDGALTDAVLEVISKGESDFADRLQKMTEAKARGAGRGGVRSGGGGGGGGGSRGVATTQTAKDEDIPF